MFKVLFLSIALITASNKREFSNKNCCYSIIFKNNSEISRNTIYTLPAVKKEQINMENNLIKANIVDNTKRKLSENPKYVAFRLKYKNNPETRKYFKKYYQKKKMRNMMNPNINSNIDFNMYSNILEKSENKIKADIFDLDSIDSTEYLLNRNDNSQNIISNLMKINEFDIIESDLNDYYDELEGGHFNLKNYKSYDSSNIDGKASEILKRYKTNEKKLIRAVRNLN